MSGPATLESVQALWAYRGGFAWMYICTGSIQYLDCAAVSVGISGCLQRENLHACVQVQVLTQSRSQGEVGGAGIVASQHSNAMEKTAGREWQVETI